MSDSPGARLLIAAGAAAATADDVPPGIRSLIDNASEVLLITPVLTTKLRVWTDDVDCARHEADRRLAAILSHIETIAPDSRLRGERGSDIPLTAFDDAVRNFQPDHIVIALRAADHAAWQEENLVDRVRRRFQLPVTVFEVDRGGHLPSETTISHNAAKVSRREASAHAGTLYRKMFAVLRLPVREIEVEAAHVHEIELRGESGETPFIAILSVIIFLMPIFLLLTGLSFAAYYLAR